jgi:hypothetical protein
MLRNVDPDRRLACCPTRQAKDTKAARERLLSVTELWLAREGALGKRPAKLCSIHHRSIWSRLD